MNKKPKYLQSAPYSKLYPYKICLVTHTKRELMNILKNDLRPHKIGREKRCGYVGFIYCDDLKDALRLRERFYHRKDMYVFLQDDTKLIEFYSEGKKVGK